jgi:hypothetical protein
MANLKKSAEYYQNQRETVGDVWKQVKQDGLKATGKIVRCGIRCGCSKLIYLMSLVILSW